MLANASDDLVFHVRNVHHVVDLVATKLQITSDKIGKDKGAEVPNVCKVMHCGAATIHPD